MEIYVDQFGNEATVESLMDMFGENWEVEAANLGYSKKAEGVVAEDATVTPVPVASENMESNLVSSSSGSNIIDSGEVINFDEWEAITPDDNITTVVVPDDRKFGDIIKIPDFEKQTTEDLASAYNTLYGGKNGGFYF